MDPAEIKACERKTWDALCKSGSSLIPLLAEDSIMLFPGGMTLSKHSTPSLESVLTSEMFVPWQKYTISEDEVRFLDSQATSALITYQVVAERPGEENPIVFQALCSSTWRKSNQPQRDSGQWEMVSHQQTPI